METLRRLLVRVLIVSLALYFTPVHAGQKAGCMVSPEPVYDAGGFWYPAQVQMCSSSIADITQGDRRAAPSQQLILSVGRHSLIERGLQYRPPGRFFRGFPNKAYLIPPDDEYAFVMAPITYNKKFYNWNELGRALPFVPTKFYDLGVVEGGFRFIAYSGLKILPSRAADAYPLKENSIIVSMNGFSFTDESALLAQLAGSWPSNTTRSLLVEFVYYQPEDKIMRRAFIPQLPREMVAAEWEAASAHPGAQWLASGSSELRNRLGSYIAYAGALLAVGALMAGVNALSDSNASSGAKSSGGDAFKQNEAKDRRERPRTRRSAPAINPFYDEPGWGSAKPKY